MRKSILAISVLSFIGITQAAYTIKIPFEQAQGGALPNGSINFTPRTPPLPVENWQPAEALYNNWVNQGDIYGCSNWTPATSTQPIGVIFQQTANDCKQDQTTTKQDREQETKTLAYRNVEAPVSMTKTITASSTITATGTSNCSYSRGIPGIPDIFWKAGAGSANGETDYYGAVVNGYEIKYDRGFYITTFTRYGVTYTRGTTIKSTISSVFGPYNYYEVCK